MGDKPVKIQKYLCYLKVLQYLRPAVFSGLDFQSAIFLAFSLHFHDLRIRSTCNGQFTRLVLLHTVYDLEGSVTQFHYA
jgi:hypothetical protein